MSKGFKDLKHYILLGRNHKQTNLASTLPCVYAHVCMCLVCHRGRRATVIAMVMVKQKYKNFQFDSDIGDVSGFGKNRSTPNSEIGEVGGHSEIANLRIGIRRSLKSEFGDWRFHRTDEKRYDKNAKFCNY